MARLLVAIQIAFSYPMQCHPCRNAVLTLWKAWDDRQANAKITASSASDSQDVESSPTSPPVSPLHNKSAIEIEMTSLVAHPDNPDDTTRDSEIRLDSLGIEVSAANRTNNSNIFRFYQLLSDGNVRYWLVTVRVIIFVHNNR